MSEIVERVARAMMAEIRRDGDERIDVEKMRAFARAAIEAMREPTEEMLSSGSSNLGDLDVEFAPYSETRRGALECWQDMISAALAPK